MPDISPITGLPAGKPVNGRDDQKVAAEHGAMLDLGRDYTLLEALTILRRATFDPGQFTKRVQYRDGEIETLARWQARAALIGLSRVGPDLEAKWGSAGTVGHITTYEVAELERLLCGEPDA